VTSPEEFRDTHGYYTTWTNEVYDLYFALLADTAVAVTGRVTQPADQTSQPAPAA
jgi:hypothetical protein